jgi:hypothetical protein
MHKVNLIWYVIGVAIVWAVILGAAAARVRPMHWKDGNRQTKSRFA